MVVVAGIDVSKVSLEAWVAHGPTVLRFDNSTDGITALAEWLKERDVSEAVCEPTGGYERQLTSDSWKKLVRTPIRSIPTGCGPSPWPMGSWRSTNGLDARVLSLFGHTFPMADTQRSKPDPERVELRDQ